MKIKPKCEAPGCARQAEVNGFCVSHYQQIRRGRPIAALRGPGGRIGEEALVTFGVRVSRACADALDLLGGRATAARAILEQEAPRRVAALGMVLGAEAAAETFSTRLPRKKRRNGD